MKVSRPNFEDWTGEADLVINPKQLTVNGATVVDKVYDGTDGAEVVYDSVSGIVEGDDVAVSVSGEYASSDVGIWDVTATYTLSGDDAGNYIAPAEQTIRALITSAEIEGVELAGGTVVYDAQAHTYTLTGLEEGDTVLYSTNGFKYDLTEMPEYTNAGVYTIYAKVIRANHADWTGTADLEITPAPISVSGTTVSDKDFDGTSAAEVTVGEITGIVPGDDVEMTATGEFASSDAGTWDVTVTYALSGADAANYTVPEPEILNAEIDPASSTEYSFSGGSLVYDGQAHSFILGGVQDGDTVLYSLDGETFDLTECPEYTNAGSYTVYVKVSRPNFDDWTGEATLVIAQREITVSGTTVDDKVYDGTTAASIHLGTAKGIIVGDDVTVTYTGEFGSANAGNYDVTVYYGITGADTANYVLATESETDRASIAKATITVTGTTVADKVYDKSADATVTLGEIYGIADGDDVAVEVSGAFADAQAGNNKAVTVVYTLSGADASNYTVLPESQTLSADIEKAVITVTGTTVADKQYDGTDSARITLGEVTGKLAGDDVAVNYAGAFASPNAGTYDVTVTYTLTGDTASNYVLAEAGVTDTAEIIPIQITVNGTTVSEKQYDGTADAAVSLGTTVGILPGDDVTVTATGIFDGAEVGEHTVEVTYTITGEQAQNYYAPISETFNSAINPLPGTGYAFTGGSVIYDGSAHTFTLTGIGEGDTVLYSLDGQSYLLTEKPEYTDAGTYTVYVRVSNPNQTDWFGEATLAIAPREHENGERRRYDRPAYTEILRKNQGKQAYQICCNAESERVQRRGHRRRSNALASAKSAPKREVVSHSAAEPRVKHDYPPRIGEQPKRYSARNHAF